MSYLKKTDVNNYFGDRLNSILVHKGYKFTKGKKLFHKDLSNGAVFLYYKILDSYNFEKDEVCWEIETQIYVRFDNLNKWFHKFEHRTKGDLKYDWTFGEELSEKLILDVDEIDYERLISSYCDTIVLKINEFLNKYKNLKVVEEDLVSSNIEKLIRGESLEFRVLIRDLSLLWVVDKNKFEQHYPNYYERIKLMNDNKEPMVSLYFPKWEEIITELKNIDVEVQDIVLDKPIEG